MKTDDLTEEEKTRLLEFDFLKAEGLGDAPDSEKKAFLEKIGRQILYRVVERVEQSLAPEKKSEFKKLFEGTSPEEARVSFLEQNAPDFEEILMEEAVQFKMDAMKRFPHE